jgi:glycosyltransferase involved in cell wall biosynthesis
VITAPPLVSVGLPVRNAETTIADVVGSVLAQDHENLELVITDNASTDDTETVCRELARGDARIVYCRQPENIGLLPNFVFAMYRAQGEYFRWIGDDDWLATDYVSRCLAALTARPDAVLATTFLEYTGPDGETADLVAYDPTPLASADPVDRVSAMLDALNAHEFVVDPLYALMRRDRVVAIPRRNMFQEDQAYAVKLALAGPWTHVPAVLAGRNVREAHAAAAARRLDVPAWQVRMPTFLLCREILRELSPVGLDARQRWRSYWEVARFYGGRQAHIASNRVHRVRRLATEVR